MRRTTKADLATVVEIINRELKTDTYSIGWAYGQPRLERNKGSQNVSPRLSPSQLLQWCWAFIDGIRAAQEQPVSIKFTNPEAK